MARIVLAWLVVVLLVAGCTGENLTGPGPGSGTVTGLRLSGTIVGFDGIAGRVDAVAWVWVDGSLKGLITNHKDTGALSADGRFSVDLSPLNRETDKPYFQPMQFADCSTASVNPHGAGFIAVEMLNVMAPNGGQQGTAVLASSVEVADSWFEHDGTKVSFFYVREDVTITGSCSWEDYGFQFGLLELRAGWNIVAMHSSVVQGFRTLQYEVRDDISGLNWYYRKVGGAAANVQVLPYHSSTAFLSR